MEEEILAFNKRRGWLLIFIVSVFSFTMTRLSKYFSIFYPELLEKYDSSATATGWIVGVQNLLRLGLGKYIYL